MVTAQENATKSENKKQFIEWLCFLVTHENIWKKIKKKNMS